MTWDTDYQTGTHVRYWPSEEVLRFAARLPASQRILEIGCGTGANLWPLAERGHEVYGLDASSAAIELATTYLRQRGVRAELVTRDLRDDLADLGVMDAILDVQCLQHVLTERVTVLRALRARLREGGLFFSMHLAAGTEYRALYPDEPEARCLTHIEYTAELHDAGFSVARVGLTVRESPRGMGRWWSVDAEAR